jgi:hypothetical protein
MAKKGESLLALNDFLNEKVESSDDVKFMAYFEDANGNVVTFERADFDFHNKVRASLDKIDDVRRKKGQLEKIMQRKGGEDDLIIFNQKDVDDDDDDDYENDNDDDDSTTTQSAKVEVKAIDVDALFKSILEHVLKGK